MLKNSLDLSSERTVAHSGRRGIVNYACAICAGLSIGIFQWRVTSNEGQAILPLWIKFTLIAVVCYLLSTWITERFWKGRLARLLPGWVPIVILGSLLYECLTLIPSMYKFWNDPLTQTMQPDLTDFVSRQLSILRTALVVDWIVTLPAVLVIYYANTIIRLIKYRADRVEGSSSILLK